MTATKAGVMPAEPAPAPAPAAPEPAPAPAPSFAALWGSIDFSAPPKGMRIREMLIPEQVTAAAKALVDALETVRQSRTVAIDIGQGDGRAWPRDLPRDVSNCEYLRIAVRKEIERRGHRAVSGTPASGVWQVSPLYGRDTIHWRFRVIAPKR